MSGVNLPPALAPAQWDKHKSALAKLPKAPATKLPDELKALTSQHLKVDWSDYGADKLDSAEAAQARQGVLEEAAKGKLKTLMEQARAVEAAAAKFETEAKKDKAFPKDPLAAAVAIVKAAALYRSEVEAAIAAARKALGTVAQALAAKAAKAATKEADKEDASPTKPMADSKAAKLVRGRVKDAIRNIRSPKPGAKPVRFVVVAGKLSAATYMGPSAGAGQEKLLKELLADEKPFKTHKDPAGQVVWEKNAVTFVSDVLPAAVLKRMQLWLRKLLKLNLKLRVRRSNGESEETEGEAIPDELLKPDAAELAEQKAAVAGLQARLAKLQPAIKAAFAWPNGADARALMGSIAQALQDKAFDAALADLDEMELLLEAGPAEPAADGASGDAELPPEAPPKPTAKAAGPSRAEALGRWKTQREAAVTTLKKVATKIGGARHAASAQAIVEIQAVIKNLTPEPATKAQVGELQRWLKSDDVVSDVCELAEDIRTPLVQALGELEAALA